MGDKRTETGGKGAGHNPSRIPQWSRKAGDDKNWLDKDADVENGLEVTGRGKGKLGRSERVAWTLSIYTTKCKIDS